MTIEGRATGSARPASRSISLHFRLEGPTRAQAELLVGRYQDG